MSFRPKKSDGGNLRYDTAWIKKFRALAGFSWPPSMDSAEWGIVLIAAGWSQERIAEFFRDELTVEDIVRSSEWPAFSASLLAGLGRWRYIEFLNEWRCSSDLKKSKNRNKGVKRVRQLIEITKESERTKALEHEHKTNEIHTWLQRLARGELILGSHQSDSVIPFEFRTRGITYAQAARFHSGIMQTNPSAYIKRRIKKKSLTEPVGGGWCKQYDIRQFPPGCHKDLRDPPASRPTK